MPMRGEISLPVRSRAWERPDAKSVWRRIVERLQNPDLQLILIFGVIGLLASFVLIRILPFSPEIAAGLAQLS